MSVDGVISVVVRKLGDLLIEEAHLLHGVSDQFKSLERELRRIRCFLKEAEAKQIDDERVRNWVSEIRDVSYEAEDVIDIYVAKIARRRRGGFVGGVRRYSCILRALIDRHKCGTKIQKIKSKIDEISNSRLTYGIRDVNEEGQEMSSSSKRLHEHRRFSALFEEADVVGLQENMKTVVAQLIDGESRRQVISIVGMGGSGKTTLAKKVYNCSDVKEHFDCRAFIYLSQQYKLREILINIIKCLMGLSKDEMETSDEVDLGKKLFDHLSDKSYLVVIDDIWNKEAWNQLNLVLPDHSNKSRVMLTTRNREVAKHADPTSDPHMQHLLNEEESWELFLKRIFLVKNTSAICPKELEGIGRKILAKCGGLPLAIVVLGGLLSIRENTLNEWSKVLDSVTWQLAHGTNSCTGILALSYDDLPHYLKPCFLYLGLFPEDSEISSSKIIHLWIAEGFIEQKENEIMEDVAEDYLQELLGRSMIQVVRKRSDGLVIKFRIHDLLRDLSISEAKKNNFFEISGDNDAISSSTIVRRLAIYTTDEGDNMNGTYSCFHSMFYLPNSFDTAFLRSMLCFFRSRVYLSKLLDKRVKLLRVLDLEGAHISSRTIPKEIGEVVHLRYLNLTFTRIRSLPSSIGSLYNLQTLYVYGISLPNAIWNLERLRHLCAYRCVIKGHPRLSNLRNLQTLCLNAGSWIEDGLDKLTNLRNLVIFEDLSSHHRALSNSIEKLCSLRSFRLFNGNSIPKSMSFSRHQHLYEIYLDGRIEKLPDFPPNIVELILEKSQLQQDSMSTLEKLSTLRMFMLDTNSYCGKEMKCSAEGFPRLEILELWNLEELEELIVEEGGMPNLKSVEIDGCDRLNTLPERLRNLIFKKGEIP